MSDIWMWLVALGAFHGINPAMGWLFAVALGLQEQSRTAVVRSLLPIAIGHALSIALVVAALVALRELMQLWLLQAGAALVLVGFGVYRLVRRHRARVGMRVGFIDLTMWSFLMATGHGAGLMLVPVLLQLPTGHAQVPGSHTHSIWMAAGGGTVGTTLLAVTVHTLAMLAVTGLIAIVVYQWVGLAFLRRGWINLDLLWSLALIGAGGVLLLH